MKDMKIYTHHSSDDIERGEGFNRLPSQFIIEPIPITKVRNYYFLRRKFRQEFKPGYASVSFSSFNSIGKTRFPCNFVPRYGIIELNIRV